MKYSDSCVLDRFNESKFDRYGPVQGFVDCGSSLPMPDALDQKSRDGDVSRRFQKSRTILAVAPTVLLFGMYAAAIFSTVSIGPAWAGFAVGATITGSLAFWAYHR